MNFKINGDIYSDNGIYLGRITDDGDLRLESLTVSELEISQELAGQVGARLTETNWPNLRDWPTCYLNHLKKCGIITFYECGSCGAYHPQAFQGDCRDDSNRLTLGDIPDDAVILTLEEQLAEEKQELE